MGAVFLLQLREHLVSLRVLVSLGIVLGFFFLNGAIYAWRFLEMRQDEQPMRADIDSRYERVSTVADAVGGSFRIANEPTGTEFMTEGGFDWFWGAAWVGPGTGDYPGFYYGRDVNVWMERFDNLDWTLIVRLVLSFLCIVLAYDGISGESERGTLRLLLANPISRIRVLLAKYLACLCVLGVAFLVGSLSSLLILSLSGAVQVDGGLVGRYLLYLLGTVGYLSVFLLLALGVSAASRSSASALVLLTLGWAVFTVVLPASSYVIAVRTVPLPTDGWAPAFQYWRQAQRAAVDEGLFRGRERGAVDGFASEQRGARVLAEAEDEVFRLGQAFLDRKLDRYLVAWRINLLSPAYAFQYTVEALLGTGLAKRQSFIDQAFAYRDVLRDFLRERDAADPDSPHVLFFSDYMSQQSLDGEFIPRFVDRRLSPAEGLAFSMTPFLILLAEALAAFLFALWAIRRADLTGYAVAEDA